jgi:hypothetical protein
MPIPVFSAYERRYRDRLVQPLQRRAKTLGLTLVDEAASPPAVSYEASGDGSTRG